MLHEDKDNQIFTTETIGSFVELGDILKQIHNRLISEGYIIVDGKINLILKN